MTVTVFKPLAHEALGVAPQTTVYTEYGVSISLPFFLRMLYDGNILAHCALWSPFYEGDYFPREDLLNNRLITNMWRDAKTGYDMHLTWRHAQDIAYKKTFNLDRPDWKELDVLRYKTDLTFADFDQRMHTLPALDNNIQAYNQILESYYKC